MTHAFSKRHGFAPLLKVLAVLFLAFVPAALTQQTTGAIRGRVLDGAGRPVAGASIRAESVETGVVRAANSDRAGWYALTLLPVGHYQLQIAARGFRTDLHQVVALNVGETVTVDAQLRVKALQQAVTVAAQGAQLDLANTSLGQTVGRRQMAILPLNGRDFTQLGLLQPGVVPVTPGLLQAAGGMRDGEAYAVNGQRPESNNFLIDGIGNVNAVDGGLVMRPPLDAIEEFRIITNSGGAEFGGNTGSTTDIITRSGTNQWHGSLYDYLRNDAFDARNFFASTVEPLKQNQFGGTVGGPIRRNHTFVFGYYEGLRNRQGETTAATVPTPLERQGDFSQTTDPSTGQVQPLINYMTGQPVPGNKLTSINPIAANLLQFYPLGNVSPSLYNSTQVRTDNNGQYGLKLDQYFSNRDHLFVRGMLDRAQVVDPLSPIGANVPGFPVGQDVRASGVSLEETHVYSPAWITVAKLAYLRNLLDYDEHMNHTSLSSLGFQYDPTLASAAGPPFLNIAGMGTVGDPITGPRHSVQNTFSGAYTVSWVAGAHHASAGVETSYDQINALQGIASNGFFVFANFPYSNPLANFLTGQPVFFMQGRGDLARYLRGHSLSSFVQDSWRVRPRLTLNLGLRYELLVPYTELHDRQNLWVPGAHSVVHPEAPEGLLYPGDPGVPRGLVKTDTKAFAPRIGLSWDATGNGTWVISSAYGIFYDPFTNGTGGPLQDPIGAPPWFQVSQINLPNFANPVGQATQFTPGYVTPMTLLSVDRNLTLPYAQDWNLRIEHTFGGAWTADLGYVGTKGTHLPRFVEGNPAVYMPGVSTEANVDQRRIASGCTLGQSNCIYSSVGLMSSIANSSYHALQAELNRHFAHGVSMQLAYTWSKTLDDASSFNIAGSSAQSIAGENDLAQNPFNLAAERGRSLFDAEHRLVYNYQWRLPSPAGALLNRVLGGWTMAGIVTLQSGTPFTVYDPNDVSLTGSAPEISGSSSNRPNLVGNPNTGPHTPGQWFNLQAFQALNPVTQAGQFGTAGRNIVQGPGYANWDFSLLKSITLSERQSVQFRAELFNILNHPNFELPNNQIGTPNFGRITQAGPPRLVQFALKYFF